MNINLMGSTSNTGYGIATKYIIDALHKLDHKVSLFSKGNIQADTKEELDFLNGCAANANEFDYDAPTLQIWHQFDLANRVGRGEYTAMPIFELNKFNDIEKHHLGFPDRLTVCSSWAASIIEEQIGRKADVVPLGVDSSVFNAEARTDELTTLFKPEDEYTFFNIGKWEKRKGHDTLGRCFDKAFNKTDNVRLIMMPHNPFLTPGQTRGWLNQYSTLSLASKIHVLPAVKGHKDVAAAMATVDCGVFPARAEGWNMELLEMMSCGKPVITTNYSAHTEYCDADNSFLIEPSDGLEDAYDGIWFHGQGEWMDFDLDQEEQLIEHMRFCYKNRPDNPQGIVTAGRFSWENTAKTLLTSMGVTV